MSEFTLVIGNKNYSSWSLRPWLAMKQAGIPFDEKMVLLSGDGWKDQLVRNSPSGRVPVLRHREVTVWESLAILEYLAEVFPGAGLWPSDGAARAVARAVSCEIHAGFAALRTHMPMNLRKSRPGEGGGEGVDADVGRVAAIWGDCRARFGANGPFLFGAFTNADAMYAPVVCRFRTYGVELDDTCRAYAEAVLALPALGEWTRAAESEPWVVAEGEPADSD